MISALAGVAPMIGWLLAVGLATALFQAMLQIEDTAFSLLPKLIVMVAIGLFGGFGALAGFEALAVSWISHAALWVHRPWS